MQKNSEKNRLIRLSKSVLSEIEKDAVKKVLDEGYLGMGTNVKIFENNLSVLLKRNVVTVVNGTAALHLALQSCGIGKDDEVLVQSITYLASFQAISASGANPIPCDINLDTFTIDIEDARKRLTSKTKAIMPVHYGGELGNYKQIYDFAKEYGLRVIEDAAHAFGTVRNNQIVGSFGDIVCFSFDGIKNITSGEGGCIVSDDENVLSYARDARLLGVKNDTEKRFQSKRSWEFEVVNQGWRYHMSDIMAAIGIVQLSRLEEFSIKRRNIAKIYDYKFKQNKFITTLSRNYDEVLPHIYPVILSKKIQRKDFQKYLLSKNIQTGIHYQPNHLLKLYKKQNFNFLKNTESIYKNIISLPLHPEITSDDINYIVKVIEEFTNNL